METSIPYSEIFSIAVAIIAIIVSAWAAFGTRKNEKEMVILQRRQVELGEVQEYRAQATAQQEQQLSIARSLHTWWARNSENEWGVVVENNGDLGALSQVEIAVSGNNRNSKIKIKNLVPGIHFVKSEFEGFLHPRKIKSVDTFEPLANSTKHSVLSSEFSDAVGNRWQIQNGSKAVKINN
ncbi:hypothetical protein [Corynebacterium suranareeae]|nr:hypothetical protein [Corynebacterium suranareeae]